MSNQISLQHNLIEKLREKKHRNEKKLFIVEGTTSVLEILESDYEVESLALTEDFFKNYRSKIENSNVPYAIAHEGEIKKLSTLENNTSAIAIVKQREPVAPIKDSIILALDGIRDPGNLGTIIRIADWFGIRDVVASDDTVDVYNPKTIGASVGSFARVNVVYTNLFEFLETSGMPILGTYLQGEDVHTTTLPKKGILVIGNEANGVSKHVSQLIARKITIPQYGRAESLNAAVATAIILDNWRRSAGN
jgi:RNA methyltransferase, TrmH family